MGEHLFSMPEALVQFPSTTHKKDRREEGEGMRKDRMREREKEMKKREKEIKFVT